VRDKALYELYGNIFHQGTRYPATAPAVPFLFELLKAPGVQDKHEIIELLVHLAIGYDEEQLPGGFRKDEWRLDDDGSGEPKYYSAFNNAYEAVRKELGVFVSLLRDPDARKRTYSAHALAWWPEDARQLAPQVRSALCQEKDDTAKASMILCMGLLDRYLKEPNDLSVLKQFLDPHHSILIRVAAAIALVEVEGEEAPDEARVLLESQAADPSALEARQEELPWHEQNLAQYVGRIIADEEDSE